MPRQQRISLELLETLVCLIDLDGDASQAADQLNINQPSMSKRLAVFQHVSDVLNRPWLQRNGKSWVLSDEGRRFYPAARDIVRRMHTLHDSVGNWSSRLPAVCIACGEEAIGKSVMPAISVFRRSFPDARFRVSVLHGPERIEGIANGALDLATVTHSEQDILELAGRKLSVEQLTVDPLVLILGRKAPKELHKAFEALPERNVPMSALTAFPLILPAPEGGTRIRIDDALRLNKVFEKVEIVLELEGWQTILKYVQEGIGLGIVTESTVKERSGREIPGILRIKYFDTRSLAATSTKLICRYRVGESGERDLNEHAAALRTLLIERAR